MVMVVKEKSLTDERVVSQRNTYLVNKHVLLLKNSVSGCLAVHD